MSCNVMWCIEGDRQRCASAPHTPSPDGCAQSRRRRPHSQSYRFPCRDDDASLLAPPHARTLAAIALNPFPSHGRCDDTPSAERPVEQPMPLRVCLSCVCRTCVLVGAPVGSSGARSHDTRTAYTRHTRSAAHKLRTTSYYTTHHSPLHRHYHE